jgi:hypothetical protein
VYQYYRGIGETSESHENWVGRVWLETHRVSWIWRGCWSGAERYGVVCWPQKTGDRGGQCSLENDHSLHCRPLVLNTSRPLFSLSLIHSPVSTTQLFKKPRWAERERALFSTVTTKGTTLNENLFRVRPLLLMKVLTPQQKDMYRPERNNCGLNCYLSCTPFDLKVFRDSTVWTPQQKIESKKGDRRIHEPQRCNSDIKTLRDKPFCSSRLSTVPCPLAPFLCDICFIPLLLFTAPFTPLANSRLLLPCKLFTACALYWGPRRPFQGPTLVPFRPWPGSILDAFRHSHDSAVPSWQPASLAPSVKRGAKPARLPQGCVLAPRLFRQQCHTPT